MMGVDIKFPRKAQALQYLNVRGFSPGTGPNDTDPTGGQGSGWYVPLYFYNKKNKALPNGKRKFYVIHKSGTKWVVRGGLTKKLHEDREPPN